MNKLLKIVIAAFLCLFAFNACSQTESKEEVKLGELERLTTSGIVKGSVDNEVEVYYGVPYGKAPINDLRWSRPEEPEAWEGVLDCSEKEQIAMQMATTYDASGKPTTELKGTTDCLNLDVYTTANSKQLPVIVYIHGGNNQSGSSFEISGKDIVKNEEAVYVSVNYRLGLLGFNCLPALLEDGESGNFALYDIALALKWVRDNIGNFGGDANNITVSGFSAGGRDVMAMLVSPLFEGLFDKAIVYSGGMTIADEDASAKQIASIMAPLVVEDGKANDEAVAIEWLLTDSTDVKEYLYSLPDERIVTLLGDAGIRMAKFPHLYGDDITLPSSGFENAKYVNDVPVIMLTGTTEFSLFSVFSGYFYSLGEQKDAATKFAVDYGSDFYRIFNTQLSAEKMDDDYSSDMYIVQVNYGGNESASFIPMVGSFHGIFVPMLTTEHTYGSFADFSTDGYIAMSKLFNEYVKNFIYTGNPNDSSTDVKWEPWTNANKQTLVLDANATSASAEMKDVFKTNQEIIDEIVADTTIPEDIKSVIIATIMNGRWFSDDLDECFHTPSLWIE